MLYDPREFGQCDFCSASLMKSNHSGVCHGCLELETPTEVWLVELDGLFGITADNPRDIMASSQGNSWLTKDELARATIHSKFIPRKHAACIQLLEFDRQPPEGYVGEVSEVATLVIPTLVVELFRQDK